MRAKCWRRMSPATAWRAPTASRGGSSGSPSTHAVTRGDRVAPVAAERAATDANAGWRLATLVFVALDEFQYPPDRHAVKAACSNFLDRQILLDEGFED